MKKIILMLFLSLTGCSSLKENVGEYVSDAVRQKITNDIDAILEKRGLSLKEIKQAADLNNDGSVNSNETILGLKEMTKDYVLLEAKNYVEKKLAESTASKGDLECKSKELWQWVLGLVAAYLGKQIYSAKNDGKRDARIAILEKFTGQDLDEDGVVGTVSAKSTINPETPKIT